MFFTSRKTLLNEFNHFEGNMNIFQPAIDITETALQKEVADMLGISQSYISRLEKRIIGRLKKEIAKMC